MADETRATVDSTVAAKTPIDRTTWLALFAMAVAVIVIANDFSAINVALPTMEKDFDTNINTIQWVVNAYALTFGVMIVTGGPPAGPVGAGRRPLPCTPRLRSPWAPGRGPETEAGGVA